MRHIVLALSRALVLLLLLIAPAAARSEGRPEVLDRLDHSLRLLREQGIDVNSSAVGVTDGDRTVEVLIRGDVDRERLAAAGARVGMWRPGLATARIRVSDLEKTALLAGLQSIERSRELDLLMDATVPETSVDDLWGGPAPEFSPTGYTGQNVIVGVVDTGLDLAHPDFQHTDGTTRVLYLWDQAPGPGAPPPSEFAYGQEWEAADIDAGVSSGRDIGNGHGTHITGVAAGDGSSLAGYPYVGMAPNSDIIVVQCNYLTEARILDGIEYVFQKADELGRDAVVLVASGINSGPHDGTDSFDLGVDLLSGPGRIVVAAAGNDGQKKFHGETQVNQPGAAGVVSYAIPAYPVSGSNSLEFEGWTDPGTQWSFRLISPNGTAFGPVGIGENTYVSHADGNVSIGINNDTGPRFAFAWIGSPIAGTWTIEVTAGSVPPGSVDFWITNYSLSSRVPYMVEGYTRAKLVRSPASANEAIGVGAYTVKKTWVDAQGRTSSFPGATLHEIADFSNPGPRRDGVMKPDITASGYGAGSAKASTANVSSTTILPGSEHFMMTGTSVAAACVAGAVAVLLEEHPGLDPESVKTILRTRAMRDEYTGPTPNATWGWGKLSLDPGATTGVDDRVPTPSLPVFLAAPYPNPVRDLMRVPVSLAADAGLRVAVFDARGRHVRTLHDGLLSRGDHEFPWDGRDDLDRPVASGRYYVVATDATRRQSRALAVIR